jgi:hypothetical protein
MNRVVFRAVPVRGMTIWAFRGGTGTYTRAVTLPDCIAQARVRGGQSQRSVGITWDSATLTSSSS